MCRIQDKVNVFRQSWRRVVATTQPISPAGAAGDVAAAAHRHKPEDWDIHAAVSLRCEFVFPRPLSHYGTGKNAGKLKDSAPVHITRKPRPRQNRDGVSPMPSVMPLQVLLVNDSQHRFHLRNQKVSNR